MTLLCFSLIGNTFRKKYTYRNHYKKTQPCCSHYKYLAEATVSRTVSHRCRTDATACVWARAWPMRAYWHTLCRMSCTSLPTASPDSDGSVCVLTSCWRWRTVYRTRCTCTWRCLWIFPSRGRRVVFAVGCLLPPLCRISIKKWLTINLINNTLIMISFATK